jgi:hypothetical protein
MPKFDDYSDNELGRFIREAAKANNALTDQNITTKAALQSFFKVIGLGWIADAMDVVQYAYERISTLLKNIFNKNSSSTKSSWW